MCKPRRQSHFCKLIPSISLVNVRLCKCIEVTDRWSKVRRNTRDDREMTDYESIRFFTSQTITKSLQEGQQPFDIICKGMRCAHL